MVRKSSIENIYSKDGLISYYLDNYENSLKLDFCELILCKIGRENFNSSLKLTFQQKNDIVEVINDHSSSNNEKFKECLNLLTFDQIQYIGW